MTTQKEALELALDALEGIHVGNMTPLAEINWNKAISTIKEALAQTKDAALASFPCEITDIDLTTDTVTVKMQKDDYRLGAGTYWLSNYKPFFVEEERIQESKNGRH